ncbi:uncharacterized protein UV8b_06051 [Ustilaginoidea virens]|uniref:NAD-dependent epimerase/dehydratase domain-containing protein n=1 Tax=Ustilaginoidea virens TaxID=1159556 RepID=A0A063C1K0_USTVR|nr:uncharacterized protein UV8b_06051 [Ustilaginoidea virens]QUC21810.1 hypothetical protein UV8b_06051 [Ustilaginoidea virens]GAO17623.1 hypothetical protein UVI_02051060 [Ustilaginoidea virens]
MPSIEHGSLVLVTGVNGYIGSHVAKHLLERGFRVRGTVRDDHKRGYMEALFEESHRRGEFEVQIVEDMASDGAFDTAMQDCQGVIHVASDLSLNPDPNKVIPPVLSGVRNALTAAARNPCVKRFVYTSSSTAATAPIVDTVFDVDTNTWNHDDVQAALAPSPYNDDRKLAVYAASKMLAEQECWRFMEQEKPVFTLNTVLPNCNIGRILSKEQPASTGGWYKKMWEGDKDILELLRCQFAPQHYVNVTDTAVLHLAALLELDVTGERLFACAGPFGFNETAELMEELDAAGCGDGSRRFERSTSSSKDLKTFATKRAQELLRRYSRPGFTGLKESLREAIES